MKNQLKTATPQQVEFYQQQLYPLQDEIFNLLYDRADVYLTGGPALARFYFQHR